MGWPEEKFLAGLQRVLPQTSRHVLKFYSRHFPDGSLRRSMSKGAFWSLCGSVFSRGFMLVASILMARLLGKEGFGKLGLIQVAVSMFAQFASIGVSTAAAKHIAELRQVDKVRVGRTVSLIIFVGVFSVLLTCVALFFASSWLANTVYDVPELYQPLLLGCFLLFAMVWAHMSWGLLIGFEDFRSFAVANAVQGITLICVVWFLVSWLGLFGAIMALGISYAAEIVYIWIVVFWHCRRDGIKLGISGMWAEKKVLWQYSAPSFIMTSLIGPSHIASRAIVSRIPNGLAGLGGFNAAAKWQSMVSFIPQSVSRTVLPTLSRLLGKGEHKRLKRAVVLNVVLNGGIGLAIALPLALLSPWIMSLYGPAFRGDWVIMLILLGAGVFEAVSAPLAPIAAVMNKMWWRTGAQVIGAFVLVGGTYIFVRHFGACGIAWALVSTKFVNLLCHASIAMFTVRAAKE